MEKGRTGLKGGHTATVYPTGSLSAQNKNRFEKQQKDFIYISVHNVGVDLMSATGGAEITYDNLLALQFRGYLDYSPGDIFNSHYEDLADLNADIRFGYEQRQQDLRSRNETLASDIERADLPDILFKQVDFVAIEGVSKVREQKNGTRTLLKDVGVVRDEEVEPQVKLERYAKYKLAKALLGSIRSDISEERLTGIALGLFFYEKDEEEEDSSAEKKDDEDGPSVWRRITSFQSEIFKASNGKVLQADVEIAAERAGLYDLIYPEQQQRYFYQVKAAAEKPVIVPLKDKEKLYPVITSEVSIDIAKKRLLLGETAVNAVIEGGAKPETIFKLGELLLRDKLDFKLGKYNPYRYKEWSKEDYVSYGRWLLGLVEPHRSSLNSRIIARSRKLDLGPGIEGVANGKTFKDLPEFYESLGFRVRRHGKFEHWTADDWINWGRRVVSENDGKITEQIIIERAQQSPSEPSLKMLKNAIGSIANLVESLDMRPYHKGMSQEECVSLGVAFYEKHGRLPKRSDLGTGFDLPSTAPIYKHCGGVVRFRELIEQALNSSDLQMAA